MEAHMSLVNRVASLEKIFRQDELTMTTVLQRLKRVEEHISASEGRRGAHEEANARVERALEGQRGRVEALQRQGAAAQLAEERLSGAVRAMEQRIGGDVGGIHQRLQALEAATAAAARNTDAALQAHVAKTQSAEQQLRGDVQAAHQRFIADLAGARKHMDGVDAALRTSIAEAHRSLATDLSGLSEALKAQLLNTAQTSAAAVAGLEQQLRAEAHASQQGAAAQVQRADAQEAATREALHALHRSIAADVSAVATRVQAVEAAWQTADQQRIAEIVAHRHQLEVSDAAWRTNVNDLNAQLSAALQGIRSEARAAESAATNRIAHAERRIDEMHDEVQKAVDAVAHSLGSRLAILERLREDVVEVHASLRRTREEQLRLREDLKGYPYLLESELSKLRAALEASVRAAHGDLLERLKPLSGYRNELHAAIGAANGKLWSEARGAFANLEDMKTLQKQINVLNNALHNEVVLLAEKNRELEQYTMEELRQRDRGVLVPTAIAAKDPLKKSAVRNSLPTSAGAAPMMVQLREPEHVVHERWTGAEPMQAAHKLPPLRPNPSTALTTEVVASPAFSQEMLTRLMNTETGALCPDSLVDELKNLWMELRVIQQHGGMSRDDVMETVSECRRYILDVVLADAQRSGEEFRNIILQIEKHVQELAGLEPEGGALTKTGASLALTPQGQHKRKPKKTVIRVVPRNADETCNEEGGGGADGDKALPSTSTMLLPPLIKIRPSAEAVDAVVAYRSNSPELDGSKAEEKAVSGVSPVSK